MALYYPQLATGALVQFPTRKSFEYRSVINTLSDGSTVRYADSDASMRGWELRYKGLSDAEREALEKFFAEAEGRLNSFFFLDPFQNLLTSSAEFQQEVWVKGPLLRIEEEGSTVRVTNTAQVSQTLKQTASVPGWFQYCFSAFLSADSPARIGLSLSSADGSVHSSQIAGLNETALWCSGAISGHAEELTCALEIPPGAVLRIRGLQLEAQPAPSAYKASRKTTGVYPETRFDQDALLFRASGMDNHSTVIKLVSRTGA